MTVPPVKKRKAPRTAFKKGVSGNPKGRPKLPPELKVARTFSQAALERIVYKLMHLNSAELLKVTKADSTPVIERVVARILQEAAHRGDQARIEWVLARTLGKMPERIDMNTPAAIQSVVILPSNGRELKVDDQKTIEAEKVKADKESFD